MSNKTIAAIAVAAVLLFAGCRRAEPPPNGGSSGEKSEAREEQREGGATVRGDVRERARERESEEREDDSEEAKEAAEDARLRQRALEQLKEFRAKTCAEAIGNVTVLLRSKKDRWLERNERGQIPGDLVQTLTQAELWGAQSEAVCKDDPARSHLDALRNLMATIWQYPRAVSREVLEERLRVLG